MEKKEKPMDAIKAYLGNYKYLIAAGRTLAAVSAIIGFLPFYEIWKIIHIAIEGTNLNQISHEALIAVISTCAALILYIAALMCNHISAFRVQANIRIALLEKIKKLPLGVFDKEGSGKIRRIIMESTAATETYIAHTIADKTVAVVTPVGIIILFLAFDWRMGLLCLIPAVIGFMFLATMKGKSTMKMMADYQKALDQMSSEAVEYVRCIPVVKTFGQTVNSFSRFKSSIDSYEKLVIGFTKFLCGKMAGFITAINAIFAVIIMIAIGFSKGGITAELVSNVMYYIIVTPLITLTLTKMTYSGEAEMTLVQSMKKVDNIIEMREIPESHSNSDLADFDIEMQNVSFAYEDSNRNAVNNLSLKIPSGSKIALVGPSGGGKSTTAQLIARFFDVTSGSIKIGGKDIKDISSSELMNKISFVFQDSKLLKTSIFENVRMAKPEATEEEVLAALKKAQCMDIIDKLPEGIHTIIGSKGTYVSGGEQQRIAVARAIIKNAPIIILDEATAFADPDNEIKMQAAFEELSKGKTLIMIAHRLTTVTDCDKIFVMNDGNLVESGSHEELMNSKGLYSSMFQEFKNSVEWKVNNSKEGK